MLKKISELNEHDLKGAVSREFCLGFLHEVAWTNEPYAYFFNKSLKLSPKKTLPVPLITSLKCLAVFWRRYSKGLHDYLDIFAYITVHILRNPHKLFKMGPKSAKIL